LNEFGYFAAADPDAPLQSSRPGIFLAGACSGPTDIQGSRKEAMAVAGLVAEKSGEESRRRVRKRVLREAAVAP
jgi:heterodisulfide reductase subunit A-like polyferredoxin